MSGSPIEWTYWDLDWHDGGNPTDEEFVDPTKGRMWQPWMRLPDAMFHRMTWGAPIQDWDDAIVADSDDDFPIEDFPYAHEAPIASQRAMELIERLAPGCVQFLPVIMTHNRKPMRVGRYWVMNVVTTVDCLEPEPGTTTPLPERIGKHMPADNVQLERSRTRFIRKAIPSDVPLFRMRREYLTVIARDDIRRAFEDLQITGCLFKPLPFQIV